MTLDVKKFGGMEQYTSIFLHESLRLKKSLHEKKNVILHF